MRLPWYSAEIVEPCTERRLRRVVQAWVKPARARWEFSAEMTAFLPDRL